MKALIDTNILIDTIASRKPFNEMSELVFMHCALKTVNMYVCASQITDVFNIINRSFHDKKETARCISKLIKLFRPLDCIEYDLNNALSSNLDDFEDAVMESVAYRNDCDFIVTRNIKDFANSRVKAITPGEFVSYIEA